MLIWRIMTTGIPGDDNKAIITDELEQLRQKILSFRSELCERVEELKETGDAVTLDQTRVGRLSRMDVMQTQQMALEAARRHQQQLKN